MTSINEVIESLEKCETIQSADYCLNKCPYRKSVDCSHKRKYETIELLKEYRKLKEQKE